MDDEQGRGDENRANSVDWRIRQLESDLLRERRARESIEASTTWRMTAALRGLLQRFPGLRRFLARATRRVTRQRPSAASESSERPASHQRFLGGRLLGAGGQRLACFIDLKAGPFANHYVCSIGIAVPERTLPLAADETGVAQARPVVVYGLEPSAGHAPDTRLTFTASAGRFLAALPRPLGEEFLCQLTLEGPPLEPGWLEQLAPDTITVDGQPFAEARLSGRGDLELVYRRSPSAPTATEKPPALASTPAVPDISIIILSYGNAALVAACVISILDNPPLRPYEIIVLDNGSDTEVQEQLARFQMPVQLILLSRNRFFGEGNNIAAEQARGRFLLFLNNDCFVHSGTIERLAAALDQEPRFAAAGPVFLYPDGRLQEAGGFVLPAGTIMQRGKGVDGFDVAELPQIEPVDYCSAACLMVRRETFDQVSGFDPAFEPGYCEDVDLCLRMADQGARTCLVREAVAVHVENVSFARAEWVAATTRLRHRNQRLLVDRRTAPVTAPPTPQCTDADSAPYADATAWASHVWCDDAPEAALMPLLATLARLGSLVLGCNVPVSRHRLVAQARALGGSLDGNRVTVVGPDHPCRGDAIRFDARGLPQQAGQARTVRIRLPHSRPDAHLPTSEDADIIVPLATMLTPVRLPDPIPAAEKSAQRRVVLLLPPKLDDGEAVLYRLAPFLSRWAATQQDVPDLEISVTVPMEMGSVGADWDRRLGALCTQESPDGTLWRWLGALAPRALDRTLAQAMLVVIADSPGQPGATGHVTADNHWAYRWVVSATASGRRPIVIGSSLLDGTLSRLGLETSVCYPDLERLQKKIPERSLERALDLVRRQQYLAPIYSTQHEGPSQFTFSACEARWYRTISMLKQRAISPESSSKLDTE